MYGDVFAWGAFSDGDIDTVPHAQGYRITSMTASLTRSDIVCVTPAGHRRMHYLVGRESKPQRDAYGGGSDDDDAGPVSILELADAMLAKQVAFGEAHTALVAEDGSVFTWGDNAWGQLGAGHNNRQLDAELVTHVEKQVVRSVACGSAHTVMLNSQGDVYVCGRAREGQLGHGLKHNKARAKAGMSRGFQPVPKYVPPNPTHTHTHKTRTIDAQATPPTWAELRVHTIRWAIRAVVSRPVAVVRGHPLAGLCRRSSSHRSVSSRVAPSSPPPSHVTVRCTRGVRVAAGSSASGE